MSGELYDPSVFFPAFQAAGFTKLATVKTKGGPFDVQIRSIEPDRSNVLGSARSKDYEIEYQFADLPRLAEGDQVTIWTDDTKTAGTKFRVREAPFVPDQAYEGNDGYFRHARLTKV